MMQAVAIAVLVDLCEVSQHLELCSTSKLCSQAQPTGNNCYHMSVHGA